MRQGARISRRHDIKYLPTQLTQRILFDVSAYAARMHIAFLQQTYMNSCCITKLRSIETYKYFQKIQGNLVLPFFCTESLARGIHWKNNFLIGKNISI